MAVAVWIGAARLLVGIEGAVFGLKLDTPQSWLLTTVNLVLSTALFYWLSQRQKKIREKVLQHFRLHPDGWFSGLDLKDKGVVSSGSVYSHLRQLEEDGLIVSRTNYTIPYEQFIARGRKPKVEYQLKKE